MKLFSSKNTQPFVPKEYRPIGWLRVTSILSFALALCIILATIYFVYNNVYVIVGSVDSILTLQADLKIEPIDFNKLERVNAAWNTKHANTIIVLPHDPFHALVTSTASGNTTPSLTVQQ